MINLKTCEKLSEVTKPLSDWQPTAFDAGFQAQATLARQHVGRVCPKLEDVDTVLEKCYANGEWQYRYCERGSGDLRPGTRILEDRSEVEKGARKQ